MFCVFFATHKRFKIKDAWNNWNASDNYTMSLSWVVSLLRWRQIRASFNVCYIFYKRLFWRLNERRDCWKLLVLFRKGEAVQQQFRWCHTHRSEHSGVWCQFTVQFADSSCISVWILLRTQISSHYLKTCCLDEPITLNYNWVRECVCVPCDGLVPWPGYTLPCTPFIKAQLWL